MAEFKSFRRLLAEKLEQDISNLSEESEKKQYLVSCKVGTGESTLDVFVQDSEKTSASKNASSLLKKIGFKNVTSGLVLSRSEFFRDYNRSVAVTVSMNNGVEVTFLTEGRNGKTAVAEIKEIFNKEKVSFPSSVKVWQFPGLYESINEELDYFEESEVDPEDLADPEECDCDPEEECDCFSEEVEGELDEAKFVFKVNSRGTKTRKMRCKPGYRVAMVGGRQRCVRVSGKEKILKKRAIRKANRTKKSKGAGYKKRVVFKAKRAIRKRRAMGLKNVSRK